MKNEKRALSVGRKSFSAPEFYICNDFRNGIFKLVYFDFESIEKCDKAIFFCVFMLMNYLRMTVSDVAKILLELVKITRQKTFLASSLQPHYELIF